MDFFYHESGLRLPKTVSLLPVYGSILMPRAHLPVPIFEEQRVVVNIMGVCRFDIAEVTETSAGCRNAQVVYERYLQDLQELKEIQIDRERLLQALDGYFRQYDVAPNWKEIDQTTDAKLIAALTMVCPFDAREKQALLEAPSLELQSEMITQLIEFANFEGASPSMTRH